MEVHALFKCTKSLIMQIDAHGFRFVRFADAKSKADFIENLIHLKTACKKMAAILSGNRDRDINKHENN